MSEQTYTELEQQLETAGPNGVIGHLIAALREEKQYHPLFDALLMQKRHELGVPLTRPTSFDTIPADKRDEFEKAYIAAAREVGELFLKEGSIPQAWLYLRTIREPQKIAEAIDAIPSGAPAEEDIIDIAFFQGVSPVIGLSMLLASHGTCSTITSLDQHFGQLPPDVRTKCSAVMVRELYNSLRETLQQEVLRRQAMTPPGQSIRQLITGRDWLFADDNYHIDVSHLNSVVRFGRSLDATSPELDLALQLAQYGARLSTQYQYAGTTPFEDFYPAHIHFFNALGGTGRDEALEYFREKLGENVGDPESQLAAVALVDLLQRIGLDEQALELACQYLATSGDEYGISIPDICAKTGRYDMLLKVAREQRDIINYTAALLGNA